MRTATTKRGSRFGGGADRHYLDALALRVAAYDEQHYPRRGWNGVRRSSASGG